MGLWSDGFQGNEEFENLEKENGNLFPSFLLMGQRGMRFCPQGIFWRNSPKEKGRARYRRKRESL